MQLLLVFLLVVEEALYSSSPLCDGVQFVLILHCKEEKRIIACTPPLLLTMEYDLYAPSISRRRGWRGGGQEEQDTCSIARRRG